MRRGQITLFIIIGLVFVIIVALTLYAVEQQRNTGLKQVLNKAVEATPILLKDCEDGTIDGQCSLTQPLRCNHGIMQARCQDCGCPTNELCGVNGTCAGKSEEAQSNFTFYIVPIGYAPTDREFLLRTEIVKTTLFAQFPLTDSNFVVVEDTLPDTDCLTITSNFNTHVQQWLQKETGKGLPGMKFEGSIPIYPYRIIGIGQKSQNLTRCGCAHTLVYSPNIYLGGADCSFASHVALHELGHTIGLCDEYDTCVYDDTNQYMDNGFGHRCLNDKPNNFNSDCGISCCSTDGTACCNGLYADTKADGFFNIMGSADVPPPRRLDTRTKGFFKAYFCSTLGVC